LRPVAGTVDDPDVAGALQLRGHPDTGRGIRRRTRSASGSVRPSFAT